MSTQPNRIPMGSHPVVLSTAAKTAQPVYSRSLRAGRTHRAAAPAHDSVRELDLRVQAPHGHARAQAAGLGLKADCRVGTYSGLTFELTVYVYLLGVGAAFLNVVADQLLGAPPVGHTAGQRARECLATAVGRRLACVLVGR